MKILGLTLVILGIVVLVFGGIGYYRQRTVFEVGGMKATVAERQTIPMAPIAGAIALAAGVGMLISTRQRHAGG